MIGFRQIHMMLPLLDVYALHQRVWRWFPREEGEGRPFLYRWDRVDSRLLVNLRVASDCPLPEDLAAAAVDMTVDGHVGATHGFSIRLVAERRSRHQVIPGSPRGAEVGDWFAERAPDFGFTVETVVEATSAPLVFYKRRRRITLNDARVRGQLTITDSDRFAKALLHGMGRHKGFGFGMLELENATKENTPCS